MKVIDDTGLTTMVNNSLVECQAQSWLQSATFKEVLGSDSSHKSLFVLLEHINGDKGVMLLNKSAFNDSAEPIAQMIKSAKLEEISKNDIFGAYEVLVPAELNTIKSQLIYPATDKIIAKYRQEDKFIISETGHDYDTITKEYIEKYQMNLTWVYNLLSKKAESERIICEDPDQHNGFILAPDIKWDGKTIESMYVLAIVRRHGIKSVRDLTGDDLPLLTNVRDRCLATIKEKYGVRPDQVRAYFHYQPSFYHLHVHFVSLKYDAPASSTLSAILLDDVINNLTLISDYYKKATLSFTRKKSDKLLEMFRDAGRC